MLCCSSSPMEVQYYGIFGKNEPLCYYCGGANNLLELDDKVCFPLCTVFNIAKKKKVEKRQRKRNKDDFKLLFILHFFGPLP